MRPEVKPLLVAVLIFAAILCVYAFGIKSVPMIIQDRYNQPTGEIYGDIVIGQSFVATENNLSRVDIQFATSTRKNTEEIIFGLREAASTREIVNITLSAENIIDGAYHNFVFDPIPESKEKSYIFYIHSPRSTPGSNIAICYTAEDVYSNGTAQINDKPIEGDLRFRVYYTYTLLDIISSTFKKFMRDNPFALAYTLFIGVISLLVMILHLREKRGC